MDMSLRDTVWTDYGQRMHNAARCARPVHSLTTLAHRSRRPASRQSPTTIEYKYTANPKARPATATIHYLEAAQPAVEQTVGAI